MASFRRMKLISEDEYWALKNRVSESSTSDLVGRGAPPPPQPPLPLPPIQEQKKPSEVENVGLEEKSEMLTDGEPDINELIITKFPKKLRSRVEKLLAYISEHSEVIFFDSILFPQIKINKVLVPNSNCILLIKSLFCKLSNSKLPLAHSKFISALKSIKIPHKIFSFQKILKSPPGKRARFLKLYH